MQVTWKELTFEATALHLAMIDEMKFLERQRDNARTRLKEDTQSLRIQLASALEQNTILLAACHEAHVTICHYDLVKRPYGVDWEPVAELQAKLEAQLWNAITLAQPELKQKEETQ